MNPQETLRKLKEAIAEGLAVKAWLEENGVGAKPKATGPVQVFDGRLYDVDVASHSSEGAAVREDLLRDAFSVMVELRAQPGAGQLHTGGDGYFLGIGDYGMEQRIDIGDLSKFGVCPCFPTPGDLSDAIDAVGRPRVQRALKVLAMMEVTQ